ncbi:MAG: carbohydrate-binding domain-containing protein [Muribaculaceae bacterium]|nr:carbohydrate-binding domain-containing protein [Muribaculaceae bacterium]
MKQIKTILTIASVLALASCSTNEPVFPDMPPEWGNGPGMPGNPGNDDGNMPDFDTQILPYQGQTATDADKDIVGTDEDIYWEANKFKNKVNVSYSGENATVETDCSDIISIVNGSHVVIDMLTNSVSGVEINVSGKSDNGSLKIYGEKKTLLNLNGVELTSQSGPAINNQCKKRLFVNLASGTENKLTDATKYSDDYYYLNGNSSESEDRKGCFFSEGNLIFSGTGSLIVAGKNKHGIASDGYMYVRPGVTIAVTEAAKNAIHIKGDKTDDIGVIIAGGLIYTLSESEAGKGIKTDYHVEIMGGQLDLNTKGDAIYDTDENDTSSAAGIKTDGNVIISGGTISIKSSGTGGKGINADGDLNITGGETTVVTTGGKYIYNAALDLDSSPKGIKADGNITIEDGTVNIMVTGVSDGSEGLESKSDLTVNGGNIFVYAYDDAINAAKSITINGGHVYAYAINNDGIDSNGTMTFNGGVTISNGSSAPEEAFDCDRSNDFKVNGGTLIGIAGAAISPASSSDQKTLIYNGLQFVKGQTIAILGEDGKPIMTFDLPRSINGSLFFSSKDLNEGATYQISSNGKLTGAYDKWNGWQDGGVWSDGTSIGSFTIKGTITTIGTSAGPGGGGGFPGGNRPR